MYRHVMSRQRGWGIICTNHLWALIATQHMYQSRLSTDRYPTTSNPWPMSISLITSQLPAILSFEQPYHKMTYGKWGNGLWGCELRRWTMRMWVLQELWGSEYQQSAIRMWVLQDHQQWAMRIGVYQPWGMTPLPNASNPIAIASLEHKEPMAHKHLWAVNR